MSEPSLPDKSHGSEAPPEVVPDAAIDSVLDQLSTTAESLGAQLGAPPAGEWPLAEPTELTGVAGDAGRALDEQLSHVQDLLVSTQELLAGDTGPDPLTGGLGGVPADGPADAVSTALPSAASDLVEQELVERGVAPAPAAKVTRPSARPALDATRPVSRVAVRAASAGIQVLDVLDFPFKRVSGPIRRVVGWCAIGTLLLALGAFALSLFSE